MLNEYFTIDDLPNDTLRAIYHYWLAMKDDRLMPSRANFNPADIAGLLPHISLIDVENTATGYGVSTRYKMRLIGSETVKAMNIDVTGSYLDELPFVERILKKNYDWLVAKKKPYFNSDKLKWSSKSFLDYHALGLPLSRNGEDVDMLMFGMYYLFPKGTRTRFYKIMT